ncbi:MAG: hypothetical protein IAE97_13650 [Chthoniobacterales bacterium]|nr:hypothetical protein [Chthoniobacterales bacterium]
MANISQNFNIDISINKFVRDNNPQVLLRDIALTEGNVYSGKFSIFENGVLVDADISDYSLELANSFNDTKLAEATGNSEDFGLSLNGNLLRNFLYNTASKDAVLNLTITVRETVHEISAIPVKVTANPSGNLGEVTNWGSLAGKPETFNPSAHADTHAPDGSDPINLEIPKAGPEDTEWPTMEGVIRPAIASFGLVDELIGNWAVRVEDGAFDWATGFADAFQASLFGDIRVSGAGVQGFGASANFEEQNLLAPEGLRWKMNNNDIANVPEINDLEPGEGGLIARQAAGLWDAVRGQRIEIVDGALDLGGDGSRLFAETINATDGFTGRSLHLHGSEGVNFSNINGNAAAAKAATLANLGFIILKPTADVSVSSNTTPTNISGMSITLAANTTYKIEAFLQIETPNPGGGHFLGINLPSLNYSATAENGFGSYVNQSNSGGALPCRLESGTLVRINRAAVNTSQQGYAYSNLFIRTGATGGTANFQWAQASSSGNASVLKSTSRVEVREI